MATVALLGTGLLGSGMVENLLRKGHAVRVWNRTASKTAPLVALGGVAAGDPAEAARGAERVHLVLTADAAVDATIAALRPGLGADVPVIDHSTNAPEAVAARFARLRAEGVRYLHAPVFMSPANARDGGGVMLVGGPRAEVAALTPALAQMTGRVWDVGERPDLAAVYKLLGNGALIGLSGVLGDLLAIGAARGLSADDVLALFGVFNPGANLPAIGARVAHAGERPASFELTMARKDVGLMLDAAGDRGLVVLPAVAEAMDAAIAAGRGAQDYPVFTKPR
jgi:3-hydroxyisobutyrate dehydrogenase